ncbi:MAG: phosphoribosylanthranilate isomerase [Chitinophagales bacterium]|jgi:phosphoribosylanthranilate isomerase|nr:phosphoribosylanthranilate isomerase [Chitinophagales bacterium]
MNIKVCGITTFKQLQQLDGLEIDMAGMVFIPDSPWYAGNTLSAAEISKADFDVKKVGILRDPSLSDALDIIDAYKLDVVQLVGQESASLCDDLSTEVEVIKSFYLQDDTSSIDELVAPYDAVCDYYLFSGALGAGNGLYGTPLSVSLLKKARIEKPFFIAGGIDATKASMIRGIDHPDFFGVDLNTEFEVAPGEKDLKSLLQFRQQLR